MQGENEWHWKISERYGKQDIPSIKRVTIKKKKFLEVSRCGLAKQRQINVQKKCAASAKLLFC